MKTNRIRLFSERQILMVILLMGLYLVAGSCDDDDDDNNSDVFRATLNGASEVPPNGSTATGTATLTYNKDTRLFSIVVEYTGITPNAGHIHLGEVGEAGNVVFGFESSLASPINYTSPALTETQENDLYAHQYYVNLHTTLYPGGEIRGQLILK